MADSSDAWRSGSRTDSGHKSGEGLDRPRDLPRHRRHSDMTGRPNIVLVHGAWAEGSCWNGVIERLQAAGYNVRAPQFPLTSLADDVARLRQVLAFQDGPTIMGGHSYG